MLYNSVGSILVLAKIAICPTIWTNSLDLHRGDAFDLSVRDVTTTVAVQSRSQIPALLLPPADPAEAKPLDLELKNGHPCRGASFTTFGNGVEWFLSYSIALSP